MKRMMVLLLALAMLCACQPTPEHEYVVNKGDNTVEDKLNATPKTEETTVQLQPSAAATQSAPEPPAVETPKPEQPVEALAPQRFPDRWDEDAADVNAHVSIAAHADVIQKADGLYPVYRLKDAPLTEAEAQALAEKLLGTPTEAYVSEMTKEDWKAMLQSYLDEVAAWQEWDAAGRPNDVDRDGQGYTPEDIAAQTAWYMAKIQDAPDGPETKAVTDYSGLHEKSESVYTLASGEKAFVAFRRGFQLYRGCTYYGHVYTESEYEVGKEEDDPNAKLWRDVTMARETAEATLRTALEQLGLTEYSVYSAEKACLLERSQEGSKPRYRSGGWSFTLTRNPAGYPSSALPWEPSQFLNYGTDPSFIANEPVAQEHVTVYVDENGLQAFGLYDRKAVTSLPNANVELLPFDDVQRIAKNTLAMCVGYDRSGERKTELEIYRMLLTTYTLRVMDSSEYYEMPCWVVFFDELADNESYRMRMRESTFETHEVLLINAIDGSIIHPDYGY